jgi:hypothetical protein
MEKRRGKVTKTYKLKDGTVKKYETTNIYKVKNGVNDGRTVQSVSAQITAEQKAEIVAKHASGVSITRICADVKLSRYIVGKLISIDEDK